MITKYFTAILNADVINPDINSRYHLEKKGAEIVFCYDETTPAKVIENIKNGSAFPLRFGTRSQTWARKFTVTGHGVENNDE